MGEPPRALAGAPAPKVWVLTALLFTLTLCGLALFSIYVEMKWEAFDGRIIASEVDRIAEIPLPAVRTKPVVAIIGTSLIRAALESAGASVSNLPDGVSVVVLSGGGENAAWFNALIPALHRAHPDLVLVEANLMRAPDGPPPELDRRIHHIEWELFWRAPAAAGHPVCEGMIERRSPKAAAIAAYYQNVFNPEWIRLDRLPVMQDLKADGISVAVLDMPRSVMLEDAAPNMRAWRDSVASQISAKGISFWHAPGEWLPEQFCDLAHLNAEGAVIFDEWLGDQLRQIFHLAR